MTFGRLVVRWMKAENESHKTSFRQLCAMKLRYHQVLLPLIGALIVCTAVFSKASQFPQPLDPLLSRAGDYVQHLQKTLTVIIGDETYRQDEWSRHTSLQVQGATRIRSRSIRSEVLFMQLPAEDFWLSVRNVLAVDGRPVPDSRQRLEEVLKTGPDYRQRLRSIQAESARYDIGTVLRTTSDPILALRFLSPGFQSRFTFSIDGQERVSGEQAVKVSFTERARPTVIIVYGRDVPATGAIWIRPSDGVILKSSLRLTTSAQVAVSISVDFDKDQRLGEWVPKRMQEQYEELSGESVTTTSTYSNFRRFETSGRLIASPSM